MFSQSFGADVYGTKARVIRIEADVSDGLPVFDMVGFLASAVKEARGLLCARWGFVFPQNALR